MKTIFLVKDTNTNEIIGANKTYDGARATLAAYLEKVGYTSGEWEEFARYNSYETVEEFKAAVRKSDDYDRDLMMDIQEMEVGE